MSQLTPHAPRFTPPQRPDYLFCGFPAAFWPRAYATELARDTGGQAGRPLQVPSEAEIGLSQYACGCLVGLSPGQCVSETQSLSLVSAFWCGHLLEALPPVALLHTRTIHDCHAGLCLLHWRRTAAASRAPAMTSPCWMHVCSVMRDRDVRRTRIGLSGCERTKRPGTRSRQHTALVRNARAHMPGSRRRTDCRRRSWRSTLSRGCWLGPLRPVSVNVDHV